MMWDVERAHWWWLVMTVGMLLFWTVVAWVVLQVLRSRESDGAPTVDDAEAVLAARFARGEIDEHEYRSRLDVLRDRGHRAA